MRTLVAVAVAALCVVPLAACQGSGSVGGDDTHQLEVRGAHTAFDVDVPTGWAITEVIDAGTCGAPTYVVSEGSELRLVVQAVPTSCEAASENSEIGNGHHGVYRTIDDVPKPQQVATVSTKLGSATVFTQDYYECTNSCHHWEEPVAIVTVGSPVDAGYPTLVVRGEQDNVSRDDLETIVASLAAPYVPAG